MNFRQKFQVGDVVRPTHMMRPPERRRIPMFVIRYDITAREDRVLVLDGNGEVYTVSVQGLKEWK